MSKGIFTETESQKTDIYGRDADRDDLIEELLRALCDSHDHLLAFSPAPRSDSLIMHIRKLVEKAERAGYGL